MYGASIGKRKVELKVDSAAVGTSTHTLCRHGRGGRDDATAEASTS
jgi:hypothetical protein